MLASDDHPLPIATVAAMPGTRHLVLLGAGYAHVHVLTELAAHPLPGVQVTLIAPHPSQMHSGMVPGFVAGHYAMEDCVIPLEPLVRRAGIRWLQRSARALDANSQTLQLDDGTSLHYDWLSVNTGPAQNREQMEKDMPGAREHGLFVRPIEVFGALWPRVAAMGAERPLRIAVIGAGSAGVELALAVRHALPSAALTLLAGNTPPGAAYPQRVQQRILAALKSRKVTVLQERALGLHADHVQLSCGAGLSCDVALLATGAQAPAWLAHSGLALDAQGFIYVNQFQSSTSHPQVFAAGDVCTRVDRPQARSDEYAVRSGPALARNLAAICRGSALHAHQPPGKTLSLLSLGDRYAVASWGDYSLEGRWVWWIKDWIDRRLITRYNTAGA